MLDKLALAFAVVSLSLGSVLLFDSVSASDLTQTAKVIGGAVFFALGLVTISIVAKNQWEWRKHYKEPAKSGSHWPPQD